MEISNNSHFSSDAYLLSQKKYKAEHGDVTPLEKPHKDQQSGREQTNKTDTVAIDKVSKKSATQTENNVTEMEPNPFQTFKLNQMHQAKSNFNGAGYKVTAHNPQMGHQAEQAVATYNSVENSQYGQNLVNRIELLV